MTAVNDVIKYKMNTVDISSVRGIRMLLAIPFVQPDSNMI